MTDVELKHEIVATNGIRLHCVTAGEGPLLLLLHGFPECWYSWRRQIPALAGAGFKVVAPDLRGYNESDKPEKGYDIDTLLNDALGLIDHYGADRAIVCGHDWGGAIAWNLAIRFPERVERLIALNLPHPALLARALRSNIRQMIRSLYIILFRIPRLPEWLLSLRNYAAIEWMFRGSAVHPEQFSDADIEVYKRAASQPGALTAMLSYYRALDPAKLAEWARGGAEAMVRAPTLMVWGEQDVALGKELTYGTAEFAPDLAIHYLPNASHWVQQDQPSEVNRLMVEFLKRSSIG
ncbi:MAG TPA: alpha/beta hydrolase [Armatimonadota bacterium]|nr:alpha/beta hydrolase [Armatimonadota bacterium]